MNRPLITIAIPTIGGRMGYLTSALDSALAQTYAPLEVVIGDNSADPSRQADLQALTARDPRIRYVRQPARLPFAASWNSVVTHARGDYLAFLADDDRLHSTFVEQLMRLRDAHPAAEIMFSDHQVIDAQSRVLADISAEFSAHYRRDELREGPLDNPELAAWRNSIPIVSMLASTSLLRAQPFKEDLNTLEIEFFVRAAQSGTKFVYCRSMLADYRTHESMETHSGLMVDRLASYLVPLAASPGCEAAKRERLAELLPGAVTRRLLQGDAPGARAFVRSGYYPRASWRRPVTWLQRLCLQLPDALAAPLFTQVYSVRHPAVRQHRGARAS